MQGLGTINTQPGHRHIAEVCQLHGISRDQLERYSKKRSIVIARHDLWFRLVVIEGFSLPKAGRLRGAKWDHTSVLHGVRKYSAALLDTRPDAGLAEIREAWQVARMGRAAA